jgi:hypothetical protein
LIICLAWSAAVPPTLTYDIHGTGLAEIHLVCFKVEKIMISHDLSCEMEDGLTQGQCSELQQT